MLPSKRLECLRSEKISRGWQSRVREAAVQRVARHLASVVCRLIFNWLRAADRRAVFYIRLHACIQDEFSAR